MKKLYPALLIAVLAITNVATLCLLSAAIGRGALAQKENEKLAFRMANYELREAQERNISDRKLPSMVEQALSIVTFWQHAYEGSSTPLERGDRMDGQVISAVTHNSLRVLTGGGEKTIAFTEIPPALRARAAIAMVEVANGKDW